MDERRVEAFGLITRTQNSSDYVIKTKHMQNNPSNLEDALALNHDVPE